MINEHYITFDFGEPAELFPSTYRRLVISESTKASFVNPSGARLDWILLHMLYHLIAPTPTPTLLIMHIGFVKLKRSMSFQIFSHTSAKELSIAMTRWAWYQRWDLKLDCKIRLDGLGFTSGQYQDQKRCDCLDVTMPFYQYMKFTTVLPL